MKDAAALACCLALCRFSSASVCAGYAKSKQPTVSTWAVWGNMLTILNARMRDYFAENGIRTA